MAGDDPGRPLVHAVFLRFKEFRNCEALGRVWLRQCYRRAVCCCYFSVFFCDLSSVSVSRELHASVRSVEFAEIS